MPVRSPLSRLAARSRRWILILAAGALLGAGWAGCRSAAQPSPVPAPGPAPPRPLTFAPRSGDEIVVAGRLFHTGTRVVTWMDPGGYDAYRVERRFAPWAESDWEKTRAAVPEITTPNRYGLRAATLTPAQIERLRGGGWELAQLQEVVDQIVLHTDASGLSRLCFETLHDHRGLSVHFLVDIDGTIYQTLDLKERAWHATTSNSRSIGIEIANLGPRPPDDAAELARWYRRDGHGRTFLAVPRDVTDPMIRTRNFTGRPARDEPVRGTIQGRELVQYDLTPEQYDALAHLTAALCTVFPRIVCDYPRDAGGRLVTSKLPDETLAGYRGLIAHYHIQASKSDPGPALQWDRLVTGARSLMSGREQPK